MLLGFEDFTARLLDWTLWWNTEHRPAPLRGRTPLQAWQDDPTPLRDVPAADLWTFTLEDAGTRTLTTRGVRFSRRDYVGPWMTGQAGIQVRVRFMPHHDHRIEVYHAATGRYLGPADLADQATDEQISAVRRARAARSPPPEEGPGGFPARALRRRDPARAAPQRLGALTTAQAEAELAQATDTDLRELALPDLIPPAAPRPTGAPRLPSPPGPRRTARPAPVQPRAPRPGRPAGRAEAPR